MTNLKKITTQTKASRATVQIAGQAMVVFATFAISASAMAATQTIDGVMADPAGTATESITQLNIRFPLTMLKKASNSVPFNVTCTPQREGFASWADNNTLWTYTFKAAGDSDARLVGGTHCAIMQNEELTNVAGKTWATGALHFDFSVAGPNVTDVYPASGFSGTLRETSPVVLITFDGPVDRAKFFADQTAYLSYTSPNAPSEKMFVTALPTDKAQDVFENFKRTGYIDIKFTDTNWILATISQNLIPGSAVSLVVQNQTSAVNTSVHSVEKFHKEFVVRSQLEAKLQCSSPSAKTGSCLPHSPISVQFNGQMKWSDLKDTYIEFIPFDSKDKKSVRSYATLGTDQEHGMWDAFFNFAGQYFPFLAQYSSTIVDSITFDINAEPVTQAKIVIAGGLKDIDGRLLSNSNQEITVRIGAMSEVIRLPQRMAFYEKNVPDLFMPMGVVNQHQSISIRKTGADAANWEPITSAADMIQLIRAYEILGDYRKVQAYVSPLDTLRLKNSTATQKMTGQKNRSTYLQFPFNSANHKKHVAPVSGLYAMEVSSPTYDATQSNVSNGQFFNPQHVLAQVTDLAVHVKIGQSQSLAWVTQLSEATPVAAAILEIYNCNGALVKTLKTDASGLAAFDNQQWSKDCQAPQGVYSEYFEPRNFYIVAKSGTDVALTHSSWASSSSFAFSSPGVDYFYSSIEEGAPHFHSIIGVNLVKPGQTVPIQLVARVPNTQGFSPVAPELLPNQARIVSNDDDNTYFDFPLIWVNGSATLNWNVPSDASVKLGRYSIIVSGSKLGSTAVTSGDIEVGEFKVPLMSGLIAFPNHTLVQPDSIPVNSNIHYANGVGAKNLPVSLSYYFEPTSIEAPIGPRGSASDLSGFSFGSGPLKLTQDESESVATSLPNSERPSTISGLVTGKDGSLASDLAAEKIADGRTVAALLKTVDRPQRLVVRVRYQDQMGEFQTLSQATSIYNSAQYVGAQLKAGNRHEAKLRAAQIDVNGKITTALDDLEIKVLRVDTKVIGEELFGGMIRNTIEREVKPVRWVNSCQLKAGILNCPVGDLKAGGYAFEVTSKASQQTANTLFRIDDQGRVYGQADLDNMDEMANKQLPLTLNKETYRRGDKAVVSFTSPFKTCQALVSIERANVIQATVVTDACQKGYVEVPVDATLAPNAFISVYALTGRAPTASLKLGEKDLGRPTYRLGFANMKVDWSKFKSDVLVQTDKQKYGPGDTVNVSVKVQPIEGKLEGGTVTVIAIEEKILELKPNDTYNLLDALMELRGHGVQTITPLEKVETVTANNIDLPGDGSRKGGNEGGDGSSKSEFQRKLFNALVSFQSDVPVVNGMAQVSFKANDSLTRFKIFAIANDSSHKFGTGTAEYLSEKDLQSFSNIPLVGHNGDSFPARVTVQNNGAKAQKFKTVVTMTIKDRNGNVIAIKVLSNQTSIDAATSQGIEAGQVTIDDNAGSVEYAIAIYDESGKLVDAMQPAPQIIFPTTPLAIHDSFLVQTTNGALNQSVNKETDALSGQGEIQVTIAKSLVTTTLAQVQTRMSADRFADFFIESAFEKALLSSSSAHPEKLKAVLQSMVGYTDKNGFLMYSVKSTRGSLELTANVLNLLAMEPWTRQVMPAALSGKFKNAVALVLSKTVDPKYIADKPTPVDWMRAQALMVRSAFAFDDAGIQAQARTVALKYEADLKRNPVAFETPIEKWSNNELLSFWWMNIAADTSTAVASPVYTELLSAARLSHAGNSSTLKGHPVFENYYTDQTVDTSLLLAGVATLKGDVEVARTLAAGLVSSSKDAWYNNETLVNVAESMKAFGRAYESAAVMGHATITVPETHGATDVEWANASNGSLKTAWPDASAHVQVAQLGQGQPWVSIQALSAVPLKAARSQGIEVSKSIRNLTHDTGFQAGDVIEVTLTLASDADQSQLALQDPIPGGSNILAEAAGDYTSGEKSYAGYKLYFQSIYAGSSIVKYQYQLNNPGTFHLPPTRAEGLLLPSVFGEVPNVTMVIQ